MSFAERIAIKSRREIERMREIGRYTAEILLELRDRARPGVTTAQLDENLAALAKGQLTPEEDTWMREFGKVVHG